jgi:hypothetical protein
MIVHGIQNAKAQVTGVATVVFPVLMRVPQLFLPVKHSSSDKLKFRPAIKVVTSRQKQK